MAEVKKPKVIDTAWDGITLSDEDLKAMYANSPFSQGALDMPIDENYYDAPTPYGDRQPAGFFQSIGLGNKPINKGASLPDPKVFEGMTPEEVAQYKKFGTTKVNPTKQEVDEANLIAEMQSKLGLKSPELDQDLMEQIKSLRQESRQRIGQSEDQLDFLRGQPAQTDLSGLMALGDIWGGGKGILTKSYKAPSTPEEMITLQQKLEDMIQGQREKLMDNAAKEQFNRAQRAAADPYGKESRQMMGLRAKLWDKASKDVVSVSGKWSDAMSNAEEAQRLLSQGDYAQLRKLMPKLAKSVFGVVGTQSDKDIARIEGESFLNMWQGLKQWVHPGKFDRMTNEQLRPYLNSVSSGIDTLRAAHQARMRNLQQVYSKQAEGLNLRDMLDENGPFQKMFLEQYEKSRFPDWWEKKGDQLKEFVLSRQLKPNEAFFMSPKGKINIGPKDTRTKGWQRLPDPPLSRPEAMPAPTGQPAERTQYTAADRPVQRPMQKQPEGAVPGYPPPHPINETPVQPQTEMYPQRSPQSQDDGQVQDIVRGLHEILRQGPTRRRM